MNKIAAIIIILLLTVNMATAGEGEAILRILMKKGIISEAEYKAIKEELAAEAKQPETAQLKEEIKKEVMDEVAKAKGELPDWANRIKLSGTLQGEYRWRKYRDISGRHSDSTSDLYLRRLELGLEAQIAEWASFKSVLNSEWIGDSVNNGDERVAVDMAVINFKKEGFPLYAVVGKRTQPFGAFFNRLITDPMTQDAYETKKVGLTAGYTGPLGLDVSATVYKGEEQMTHLFASNLFSTDAIKRPSTEWTSGSSDQLRNETDDVNSYILSAQVTPIADTLTLGLAYLSEEGHQKRNTSMSASLQYNCIFLKGFTLEAEYIAALTREKYRSSAATLFGNAFKEKIWVAGASYAISDPIELAARFEHFDDDGMANTSQSWSARNRYSLGGTYTFYKDEKKGLAAFVAAEYRKTKYRLHSTQTNRANGNDEGFLRFGVTF